MAAAAGLKAITKAFGEFKDVAVKSAIAGVTIALEEILNRTIYYCPCVEPSEVAGCNTSSNSIASKRQCTPMTNYAYGLAYMIVPCLILFFFMAASTPRLWKLWTGICTKSPAARSRKEKITWTLAETFGRSLIAPVSWVCFALIDGQSYACSVTPLPYDVGPGASYESCTKVAQSKIPFHSDAYRNNRSVSQLYGWAVLGITVIIGFIGYAISRCKYPLTYYHAKYYDYYRQYEEKEFDQEMEAKAQKEAEKNVLTFMSENREKALWDQISTVYSFHRNPKNVALYSYLHEFISKEKSKKNESVLDHSVPS
uniref:calcium homeostasis modulator protein 6-like n=1 Tax=Styela clava TaxID=7725 RepID=UPI0019394323|nr:calcium homeostasis modulator protein 6-like [Styela clava]